MAFKAAIGVLLFALANVIVYRTSGFFQRESHYHQTVAGFSERPAVSVVLMGDSHVAEIPRAALGPDAYNLAAGGDGYRECYAKLRYLVAKPNKVGTLLLTADYHMFGAGRVHSANRSFVERYLLATRSPIGYEKSWLSSLFNLVPLFNDDFVQYLKKDTRERLRRARQPSHGAARVWSDLPEEVRQKRALETGRGDHAGVGEFKEPLYWFEQILELAEQHSIDVITVRYPTSEGYLSQIPAAGKQTIDAALARMGAPTVIDLGRSLKEPEYFADEDHVNDRGAAVLLCLLEKHTDLKLTAAAVHQACEMSDPSSDTEGGSR